MLRTLLPVAIVLASLTACGDGSLKAEGEECFASSECEPGLTCDFGADPHVCRPMQTPTPDAAPAPEFDAAPAPDGPDAAPGIPDAAPTPDAPPGTPDAAPTPDAQPDAAPLPDATATPDA